MGRAGEGSDRIFCAMTKRDSKARAETGAVAGRALGYGGSFTATLFRWGEGKGSWVFAPVPDKYAPPVTHGWGRTPVTATVDGHTWTTSVWRGKDGRTLLAVPKTVRKTKDDGDKVRVVLRFSSL
jgi:hypothetical protein